MLRIYVRALLFCFYFISFVSSFFFQGWLQGKQDTKNTMNLVERAQEAWVSRYLIFKVCSPEKSMIRSLPARISVLFNETCPLEYGAVLVIFFLGKTRKAVALTSGPAAWEKKSSVFLLSGGLDGREGRGKGGEAVFLFLKKRVKTGEEILIPSGESFGYSVQFVSSSNTKMPPEKKNNRGRVFNSVFSLPPT